MQYYQGKNLHEFLPDRYTYIVHVMRKCQAYVTLYIKLLINKNKNVEGITLWHLSKLPRLILPEATNTATPRPSMQTFVVNHL